MIAIIKTEFYKIKRYHILLIGIFGMLCSPLLQLFSQVMMDEEYRRSYFDFAALIEVTIWGNAQIFMTGKLAAIGLLAILFGIYSFLVTVIVGICAGLPDLNVSVLIGGLLQMVGLSIWIYIVVLPIITICGRKPGMFMGGSVIAFLTGYMVMFFKEGLLRNIYPYSAALTMIGFDTTSYAATSGKGSIPLAIVSLGSMLLIVVLIIYIFGAPGELHSMKKAKGKGRTMRTAQRKKQNAR